MVSIHAFREEGDSIGSVESARPDAVSIHAFREEGDNLRRGNILGALRVSIHAFREEGDAAAVHTTGASSGFNPRLPGGRRLRRAMCRHIQHRFNPRLPGGRRRLLDSHGLAVRRVSIHAFREEGDDHGCIADPDSGGFNPRLPGGRRPSRRVGAGARSRFQSTPSGRKATKTGCSRSSNQRFNPRLPGGRRPRGIGSRSSVEVFQSTPSGRKATRSRARHGPGRGFNPRLPGGRRPPRQSRGQ